MIPSAVQRFRQAALDLGVDINIVEFEQSTRTAAEAAAAIGCDVAQIVKSLCFSANGQPVMALVSGDNQLDKRKLAGLLDVSRKKVRRADADVVRQATGYSIGGVPPFGHVEAMPVFVDEDLLRYETVWAAAGTPNSVFAVAPERLVALASGTVADLRQE